MRYLLYLLYLRHGLKNRLILRKEDDFTGLAETHKSNAESHIFNSTSQRIPRYLYRKHM